MESWRSGDHCFGGWVRVLEERRNFRKMRSEGRKYNLYSAIPGTGAEGIFGDKIPVHSEYFPFMLLP